MPHRYDARKLNSLDHPLRRLLMPAMRTLERLGVQKGDVVIDIGAGSGYLALPACGMVGGAGQVLAVDIAPEAIEIIEHKGLVQGRKNLRTVLSTERDPGLPAGLGSLAIMFTVLHEVEDKAAMLRAIHASLRKGGRIAIVEFRGALFFGPPRSVLIAKDAMLSLLAEAGFHDAAIRPRNAMFYLATAKA